MLFRVLTTKVLTVFVVLMLVAFSGSRGSAQSSTRDRQQREAREQERRTAEMNRIGAALNADRAQTERYLSERDRDQERRTAEMNRIGAARNADRAQTERYLSERDQERRTAEMNRIGAARNADRAQTERYLSERDQERRTAEMNRIGAALNADRVQTERYLRDRDAERRTAEMNRIGAALNADRAQTERYLRERSLPARNSFEGLFDSKRGPQNVGNMVISRDERMLYLQNGDRILLPANEVWSGNARVSVDRIYDMPLHYQVTITTRQDRPLGDTINELVKTNGQAWAIRNGLMTARQVVNSRGWGLVWEAIKPQPLNSGEEEHVYWQIPSASRGLVDVHVINQKN